MEIFAISSQSISRCKKKRKSANQRAARENQSFHDFRSQALEMMLMVAQLSPRNIEALP